ncbi:MAG: hypothetical protein V4819_13390 [Verrucomicrobiota bacterium]
MKSTSLSAQQQHASEPLAPQEIHPKANVQQKVTPAAHPLYPSHQVFLWLPGMAGQELPFCSCNREAPGIAIEDGVFASDDLHDSEGNLHAPPFPVSHRTFVSWHTHLTPPVSFHPVPIKRFLSISEMEDLARKVLEVSGEELSGNAHLLSILRNEYKCYILYFLARSGLLDNTTPHRK